MPTVSRTRPRAQRLARVLAEALTAPHGPDRYLEHLNPRWALDEVRAEVVGLERAAPGTVVLSLRPTSTWEGFLAGQWVRVGVEVHGRRRLRCFSLASSMHRADGLVQLGVRATSGGVVSPYLVHAARPGLVVTLSQAEGDFTLPAARPERLLLVSGGSGVTPVLSILRTLADEGHAGAVDVLHFERTADRLVGGSALADAADAAGARLRVVETRAPGLPAGAGRFGPHLVDDVDVPTTDVYACGPPPLTEAVSDWWAEVAGPAGAARLRVEHFAPALPPLAAPRGATGGRVRFTRSGVEVRDDGRPLLEQAEAAGLQPDFGCRAGICRTCIRPLDGGAVRDLVTDVVCDDPDTEVALCTSVPAGDVALDL